MRATNDYPWLKFWIAALIIKLIGAYFIPFSHDEAYYWVWGHFPQLSYFDHPGMAGWLFYFGQAFNSYGNLARIPGLLMSHLTCGIWLAIASLSIEQLRLKMEKSETSILFFLICIHPFLGLGSFVITPDTPLLFFWSFAYFLLLKMAFTHNDWLEKPWIYLSIAFLLGLGFLSKYHIVLFLPCAIGFLYFSRITLKVKWKFVALATALGILIASPVFIWNAKNEWASFRFQLSHGLSGGSWKWNWTVEYILGQLGLLIPLIFWFFGRRPLLLSDQVPALRLWKESIFWFGLFPILFFFGTSLRAPVEANWPAMAQPVLFLGLIFVCNSRSLLKTTAFTWTILSAIVITQVFIPWLPVDATKLKTFELTRVRPVTEVIRNTPIVFATSYQVASSLSYELRDTQRIICKLPGINRKDFFDFLSECQNIPVKFSIIADANEEVENYLSRAGYKINETQILPNRFILVGVEKIEKTARD
jgi:4-amino-4-deoxy-L-arabinose transferase-like glycosyltransferase